MIISGLFVLVVVIAVSIVDASIFDQVTKNRCQPIEISLCKDIPYNYTFYPNHLLQHDPQSLQTQTEHFKPLIKTNCSPHIKFFVCSVFAPMCPEAIPQAVTSCRAVCEEVKRDCLPILENFGIGWPEPLNCSKFPQAPDLCMRPTDVSDTHHRSSTIDNHPLSIDDATGGGGNVLVLKPPVTCPDDLINLDPTDATGLCAVPCNADIMFHPNSKQFARLWMLIWSSICLVVTAFTVLTYILDRSRFRFPERCIFYLAACYHLYSWAIIIRAVILPIDEMACERQRGTIDGRAYLIAGGLDNAKCVLTFIVLYYFSIASELWWLMLTLTWYLSAGRKWVPEGIEACSSYLHFVAWGVPALLSIAVLITRKVDASELTGLCFVGNSDPLALVTFVIGPRLLLVLLGSCLIIAGFVSMCTVRDSLRTQGTDTTKLEKLMSKIGIFSALYIVPAVVLIVCESYHAFVLLEWQPAVTACKIAGGGCRRPINKPQVEFYMLNIFMSLIVGTTAGMWIVSRKTCIRWHSILCCGLLRPAPANKSPTTIVDQRRSLVTAASVDQHRRLLNTDQQCSSLRHHHHHQSRLVHHNYPPPPHMNLLPMPSQVSSTAAWSKLSSSGGAGQSPRMI